MNTTTEHLKALLVDDGREFAMVRKTDLAALMQIAQADPHQGRFLDPIGAHKAEIARLAMESGALRKIRFNQMRAALKHGEERRRYMANNKALMARVDELEKKDATQFDDYVGACQLYHGANNGLRSLSRRVACAIRKAPATCRMLGLIK